MPIAAHSGAGAQEDLPGEFETCGDLRTGAVLMTQQASFLGKDISPREVGAHQSL